MPRLAEVDPVHAEMVLQIFGVRERLTAVLADVRPLLRVRDDLVTEHVEVRLEAPSAGVALVILELIFVDRLVLLQIARLKETLVAVATLELLRHVTSPVVTVQANLPTEALAAFLALERRRTADLGEDRHARMFQYLVGRERFLRAVGRAAQLALDGSRRHGHRQFLIAFGKKLSSSWSGITTFRGAYVFEEIGFRYEALLAAVTSPFTIVRLPMFHVPNHRQKRLVAVLAFENPLGRIGTACNVSLRRFVDDAFEVVPTFGLDRRVVTERRRQFFRAQKALLLVCRHLPAVYRTLEITTAFVYVKIS